MAHAGAGAAGTVAIGEVRNAPAVATPVALSLSLQVKLKELLSLEKLETPLLPCTRMAITVMMETETLLLPTRAALSLTLAIVVVAVVVALADADVLKVQMLKMRMDWNTVCSRAG